jgi:putative transposase
MKPFDVHEKLEALALPNKVLDYAKQALASPSRLVGRGRYLSVSGRFASSKLGQVVQAESSTCELPFAHIQELDEGVLACLDQPPPLYTESIDKRGRLRRANKTPDFLVIRSDQLILYECKTREHLRSLVVEQPENWTFDGECFHHLPSEKAAASLGIAFRVHDTSSIEPVYIANLSILVNTKRSMVMPMDDRAMRRAIRMLVKRNGMTIAELAATLFAGDCVPVLAAIVAQQLHALVKWQLLSEPEMATVYGSREQLDSAESTLMAISEINCLSEQNYKAPIALSEKAMQRTTECLSRIKRIKSGELRPTRNDYRYLAKLRECEKKGESTLLELAPAYHRRGAGPSLPAETEQLICSEIGMHYASPLRWSVSALYRTISLKLRRAGLSLVSYETVRRRVRNLSRTEVALSREGYRAANAKISPRSIEHQSLQSHYAWEKAHVDSTPLDEKVWLGEPLSQVLARPQVYILVDEATSCILAYWVCFANAGDQAVACLLRDCIRRHGKLPCTIVHDRGSEYFSKYAEGFTAATGIDLLRRPPAAPRWGSHVESAFNRINHLVVHQLPGNTQNDRLGRSSVTGKRSAAHAKFGLTAFMSIVEDALMTWLNNRPLSNELSSPIDSLRESEHRFGRLARAVNLDSQTLAYTAIPVTGTRKVSSTKGISYLNRKYHGPGIKHPSLDGRKLPIRWEPYNPCIIYVEVNGLWEKLHCRGYKELEHVAHIHTFVELSMRRNISSACKAAQRDADQKMAEQLHRHLTVEEPKKLAPTPRAPVPVPVPDKVNLFDRVRDIDFSERPGSKYNG